MRGLSAEFRLTLTKFVRREFGQRHRNSLRFHDVIDAVSSNGKM